MFLTVQYRARPRSSPTALRSFLDSFDFTAIEEMDPSLAEGHRVVYDRESPPGAQAAQMLRVPDPVHQNRTPDGLYENRT